MSSRCPFTARAREKGTPPARPVVRAFNRQELARLRPIRARAGVDEPIFRFVMDLIEEHSIFDEAQLRGLWHTYQAACFRLAGTGREALEAIDVVRATGDEMAHVSSLFQRLACIFQSLHPLCRGRR